MTTRERMAERKAEVAAFLARAGLGAAERRALAGDASARRYERVGGLVLVDAPPEFEGGDLSTWLDVARRLHTAGLSVPVVHDADPARGLMLIEDLGDRAVSRESAAHPASEAELYAAAADVLGPLGAVDSGGLTDHGAALAAQTRIAAQWYAPEAAHAADALVAAVADALTALGTDRVLIHRDYHADNLFWLPDRRGVARVGIIDFQDAGAGPRDYDLASLLRDVRRDVSPAAAAAAVERAARDCDPASVAHGLAVCGAVRGLRILGVFARLARRDGKTGYLRFLPRAWALLQGDLAHPALSDLRRVVADALPAPDDAWLARTRAEPAAEAMA